MSAPATMCHGQGCDMRDACYLYRAQPLKGQAWADAPPIDPRMRMCSSFEPLPARVRLRPAPTEKPAYGDPCNACGGCCRDMRCPLGARVFGPGPDCPALDDDGTCGLVNRPKAYTTADVPEYKLRNAALLLIGSGLGCDALLHGEHRDPGFARQVLEHARRLRRKAPQALALWLSS